MHAVEYDNYVCASVSLHNIMLMHVCLMHTCYTMAVLDVYPTLSCMRGLRVVCNFHTCDTESP